MSKTSSTKALRASAVLFGSSMVTRVVGTVKGMVITRVFAPEALGEMAVALIIIGVVTAVIEAGAKRFVVTEKDTGRALGASVAILLASTPIGYAAVVGIWFVVNYALDGSQRLDVYLILGTTVLSEVLSLYRAALEKAYRFGLIRVGDLIDLVVGTAVAVASTYFFHPVVAISIGHATGVWCRAIFTYLVASPLVKLSFDKAMAKKVIAFGLPLSFAGLVGYFIESIDDYFVRQWWGSEALGEFTVAGWFPQMSLAFVGLTSTVLLPWLSERKDDKKELGEAFSRTNHIIALVAAPIGAYFTVAGSHLVEFIYGDNYAAAGPLCQILGFALMLRGATGYNWSVLALVTGQTRRIGLIAILDLLLASSVGAYLFYYYGAYGAAVYNVVQLSIMGPIVRFPIIKKAVGDLSFLRQVWRPLLFALFAAAIASLIPPFALGVVTLVAMGLTLVGVYAAMVFLLDKEGVALFKKMLNRVVNKVSGSSADKAS